MTGMLPHWKNQCPCRGALVDSRRNRRLVAAREKEVDQPPFLVHKHIAGGDCLAVLNGAKPVGDEAQSG
jgi:hypothetical protein